MTIQQTQSRGDEMSIPDVGVSSARWTALLVATVTQVAVALVAQGIPVLAPFIHRDLQLSRGGVGLVTAALNVGSLVAVRRVGWAVDRVGEDLVMSVGTALAGVFAVLAGASKRPELTFLLLLGVGMAAATSTPAGSKAIMTSFPVHRRGLAMGIRQTAIPVGGAVAALLLPRVAARYGWRSALLWAGMAVFSVGVLCTAIYGKRNKRSERPSPSLKAPAWPLGRVGRDIALLSLSGLFFPPGQFVLLTYLALYLWEHMRIPVSTGAMLLTYAQIAGAAARVLLGVISDRWLGQSRKRVLLPTIGLGAATAAAWGLVPSSAPSPVLIVLAVLSGATMLGWNGVYVALVSELADPERQGQTLAISMTAIYTGIILGPPVFGLLVDASRSYRVAWFALATVLLVGAALLTLVREGQLRDSAPDSANTGRG